jgi:hypothetical protein
MANFLIMRQEKYKSGAAIKGRAKHNFRTIPTPNANPSKLPLNDHKACTSVDEVMAKYKSLLPEKIRKNGIHAINYMITTSPESSETDNQIALKEGIDWVTEMYGSENVLLSSIHNDETTPHVHILVMPLKDGKLNARHYVGGHRDRLKQMQTELFERVKKAGANLERGIEGSKAQHQSTAKWAAKQKELGEAVKTSSKGVLQSRVELTASDLIRPKKANKRVSEALEEVLEQREDALVSVEAHKIEFDRNKNELSGLRAVNRKAERSISTLTQVKEDFLATINNPERRQLQIKQLTKLEKAYQYGRSKIDSVRDGIKDILSRTLYPSRDAGREWSGRCEREAGREWLPSDYLRTTGSTTPTERVQDRHNDLQGTEPEHSPSH